MLEIKPHKKKNVIKQERKRNKMNGDKKVNQKGNKTQSKKRWDFF
jgi:hypothetical protein